MGVQCTPCTVPSRSEKEGHGVCLDRTKEEAISLACSIPRTKGSSVVAHPRRVRKQGTGKRLATVLLPLLCRPRSPRKRNMAAPKWERGTVEEGKEKRAVGMRVRRRQIRNVIEHRREEPINNPCIALIILMPGSVKPKHYFC